VKTSTRDDLSGRLIPRPEEEPTLELEDGGRVAVIGGGPAGSFFSYFLLKLAETIDLDVSVDIYEPRHFIHCGPAGCNHCGGIVSESLVQILAAEGINLPPSVIQRGIESYVVHMDVGSVRIESPRREQRIAAVYRGNGPRDATDMPWESFDGHLQGLAATRGARIVRKLVSGIRWVGGLPILDHPDGRSGPYDLVALATGVNSNLFQLLDGLDGVDFGSRPLKTTRTYICEFHTDHETIRRVLGSSMHVFLLSLPRLEFAALIPKGEYITLVLLGEGIDAELVRRFLETPEVSRCLPPGVEPRVCNCSPLINMRGPSRPFADRMVLVGDCGMTRLFKDGIGAAYRTAKAAAETVVFHGIALDDFQKHYWPACRTIDADNKIGKLIFSTTDFLKAVRLSRRAILRMTRKEQEKDGARRMSQVLWNLFTGSAPYREVFMNTLHPAFLAGLAWNVVTALPPGGNGTRGRRRGGKGASRNGASRATAEAPPAEAAVDEPAVDGPTVDR
jgi:flavin-dependent dehydrogenase